MAAVTIDQALQIALHHHNAGRFAAAEAIYRQILAEQPDHADAWELLGVLAGQRGDFEEAVACVRRAIAVMPDRANYHVNLGELQRRRGKLDEAIASARRAIELRPAWAIGHANLGIALWQKGELEAAAEAAGQAMLLEPALAEARHTLALVRSDQKRYAEAVDLYRQALKVRPDFHQAYNSLGVALRELGRLDEAISACSMAIQLQPDYAEAHSNISVALREAGRLDEAVAAARTALGLDPKMANAHSNLSSALADAGRLEEAVAAAQAALRLEPKNAGAHNNLGFALQQQGHVENALSAYRAAVEYDPTLVKARNNLGAALAELGELDQAAAVFQAIIQSQGDYADAHVNYAQTLLTRGQFQRGWAEYEWRLKRKSLAWPYPHPQWTGEDLAGKTILLRCEQGLGDTIQFIRFAPMLSQCGATVLLRCPPQLTRLVATMPGIKRLVSADQPLPPCDFQCPLLSLPFVLGTDLPSIPAAVPYLVPDPALVHLWREKLDAYGQGFRVGLVWAGTALHKNDRNRSLPLRGLSAMAAITNVLYVSLQMGAPATQLAAPPAGMKIVDVATQLTDFADTAAVIANLDLVITVDTAVAHMAGAVGKPVWTLLPVVPDWRWLLDREDSPWYPTMRLFRQKTRGDWEKLMERVAAALDALRKK
jgi:tetratricopeptide (TPR) repeat protein